MAKLFDAQFERQPSLGERRGNWIWTRNAACCTDGVRNENVTWSAGVAPRGVYTVRVNYWDSCGAQATNYTVRVNNGGDSRTFTGTLTGSGNGSGHGPGTEVASFERRVGSVPWYGDRLISRSGRSK